MSDVASRRPLVLRVPIARVGAGVADLRGRASAKSELVDQLRFGERVTVLAQAAGWLFVQAREDHYFGWVRDFELFATEEVPARAVVAVVLATLRGAPRPDAPAIDALPAGTWLDPGERADGYVGVRGAWLRADDLVDADALPRRAPTPQDVIVAARAFLDVPYLWGGTSARGLDCSGFVQLAYRLCGIVLTRDADQQARQGRAVEGAPRAGDLVFFRTPISHVGLALDDRRMIDATESGGGVREEEIAARGTPVAIRRFLP